MTLELSAAERAYLVLLLGMVRAPVGSPELSAPRLYVGLLAKLGVEHPERYLRASEERETYLRSADTPDGSMS